MANTKIVVDCSPGFDEVEVKDDEGNVISTRRVPRPVVAEEVPLTQEEEAQRQKDVAEAQARRQAEDQRRADDEAKRQEIDALIAKPNPTPADAMRALRLARELPR